MLHRLKISQKGLIVVVALLMIELAFVLFLTFELQNTRQRLAAEQRSRAIADHLNRFACQSQRAGVEMLQSTMVPAEARDIVGWGDHRKHIDLIKSELARLEELLHDDTEAVLKLAAMRDGVEALSNLFENNLHLSKPTRKKRHRGDGQFMTKIDLKTNSQLDLMSAVRELKKQCNQLMKEYCRTKPATTDLASEETLENLRNGLLISATGSFALILGIALWFFSRVAGRILFVAGNARRFAQGEQLAPRLTGNDELAQLDSALHDLVDELALAIAQDQALLKFATDVICVVDSRNNFVDVNPAVASQLGYAPEELIGKNIDLVLPATDFAALSYGKLGKVAEESHTVSHQRVTKKNGQVIDALLSVYWSPLDGTYFSSIRDITDSKRIEDLLALQEEQVRSLIENLPAGIVTIDSDRIVSANETFRQLCGIAENELLGMSIDDLVRPVDAESSCASISQSLHRASSGGLPLRALMEDRASRTRYLDVNAVKAIGAADSGLLVVTLEDTTERRRLEELKRSFVDVMGDDIREPLKEIGGIIRELMSRVDSNSKLYPRLSRSELTVNRLLNLTGELLKIEEMTDDVLLSGLAPCAVSDLVSEAVDAIKDYAELQGIEIEATTDQSTVLADRLRLLQVIINLGSNAIKYSPKGSMVSILVLQADGKVRIEVKDRGRGIPATMQDLIFEPFVQSRKEDARHGVGTGLGLSICKKIVEAHKGKIGVISTEGEGSIFWIDLPQEVSER